VNKLLPVLALLLLSLSSRASAAAAAPPADPRALFARYHGAVGGAAWDRIAGVQTTGVAVLGGSPSPFTQLVDRANGWSKVTTKIGPLTDISGFDGAAWDFQGSAITLQTLPGLQADNVTQAYIARDGWWRSGDPATMTALDTVDGDAGARVVPAGGSPVDVYFNPASGLIDRLVAHTDTGLSTTRVDDYRAVGNVIVSFHSVTTDPTGSVSEFTTRSVMTFAALPQAAVARPQPKSLGRIAGGGSAIVPFRFEFNEGWVYTDLHVGTHTANVFFDSGASNFFFPASAKRLDLHGSGGVPIAGVGNGSVNATIAALGTIALGNAQLADQKGIVAPLPLPFTHPGAGIDVDGIVGAEFLQNLRMTFDFDDKRIVISSFDVPATPSHRAVTMHFLSDGAHAYVEATVDGAPGLYLLDTGDSGDITVFRRFADAHGLFRGPGVRYLSVGGVGGHLAYSRYRAKTFTLAGATFHDAPVSISDASAGSFASRSVAGNIGVRVLSRYLLTFDFRNTTVSFIPNAHVNAPFAVDRVGLSLNQPTAATFTVLSIVPGSPAATAGLKEGDTIVELNGTSIAAAHLGLTDSAIYTRGTRPFTLTTQAADGTKHTVTLVPRDMLPPAF
jgi:hypothetical protein